MLRLPNWFTQGLKGLNRTLWIVLDQFYIQYYICANYSVFELKALRCEYHVQIHYVNYIKDINTEDIIEDFIGFSQTKAHYSTQACNVGELFI